MKASELREQSLEELSRKLSDFEEQLFKLRFQRSTGQIEDPNKIREARRNIARVLTIINERTAAEGAGSDPAVVGNGAKGTAGAGAGTGAGENDESLTAQENGQ